MFHVSTLAFLLFFEGRNCLPDESFTTLSGHYPSMTPFDVLEVQREGIYYYAVAGVVTKVAYPDQDIFVSLYRAHDLEMEWTKVFSGPGKDQAGHLEEVPSDGGFILMGTTTAMSDATHGQIQDEEVVLRLNSNGDLMWTTLFVNNRGQSGGQKYDSVPGWITNSQDGGFIAHYMYSDMNVTNGGLLVKLSSLGEVEWATAAVDRLPFDMVFEVIEVSSEANDGSINYLAAMPNGPSFMGGDGMLVRYNELGEMLEHVVIGMGGNSFGQAHYLSEDKTVAGEESFIILGFYTPNGMSLNSYVMKIPHDFKTPTDETPFEPIWQVGYGGFSFDISEGMESTLEGDIIIAGMSDSYTGSMLIDYGDATLVKIANNGTFLWMKGYSFTDSDIGADVAVVTNPDEDGGFVLTGQSNGGAFLVYLDNNGDLTGNRTSGCEVLTQTNIEPGVAQGSFTFTANPDLRVYPETVQTMQWEVEAQDETDSWYWNSMTCDEFNMPRVPAPTPFPTAAPPTPAPTTAPTPVSFGPPAPAGSGSTPPEEPGEPSEDSTLVYIFLGVLGVFVVAYIGCRWSKKDAENFSILATGLALIDFGSDIAFAAERFGSNDSTIGIASTVFLIIPALTNMTVLLYALNKEFKIEEVSVWFVGFSVSTTVILMLSFTNLDVVMLLYSRVGSRGYFDAPFSKRFKSRMAWYGLIGNFLEDIPQLSLQIIVALRPGVPSTIVIVALVTSMLTLVFGLVRRMVFAMITRNYDIRSSISSRNIDNTRRSDGDTTQLNKRQTGGVEIVPSSAPMTFRDDLEDQNPKNLHRT